MSDISQIFESVLFNLMDSFVPQIDAIFTKFDNDLTKDSDNQDEDDLLLQKTILGFPKVVDSYQKTLDVLAEFATANPDPNDPQLKAKTQEKAANILSFLCGQFKSEANRSADKDFTLIHIASPSFRFSIFYHFQFLRCLTLIILSDIIEKIFSRLPCSEAVPKIVQCAFYNCVSPHRLDLVQDRLICIWSSIVFRVSKISVAEISQVFEQYLDETNANLVINLISKVNVNDQFVEAILLSFQQLKKHKTLTASALSSISSLLSHAQCNQNLLHEFFKLAWSVRTTDDIKDGAIDLITTLYTRLPDEAKKSSSSFYSSRVIKHIGNPAKLERTANAFFRLIQGDISSLEFTSYDDRLSNISCAGKPYDSTPFSQLFMKNFFSKAQFSICPNVFVNILIQLAAVDLQSFVTTVCPPFLKVAHQDIRYQIFLTAVSYVNKKEFKTRASCKPNDKLIKNLNELVRTSVLEAIDEFEKVALQQKMVSNYSDYVTSHIEECDQIVNDFISNKRCSGYEPEHTELNSGIKYDDSLSFLSALLSAISCVLNINDFKNNHLTKGILVLSCVDNLYLSDMANKVICDIFSHPEGQEIIITACIANTQQSTQDDFPIHCFSMIYNLLNNKEPCVSEDIINQMEALALIVLGWDSPIARLYAMDLLKYVSTIKEQSVYEMLVLNNEIICESAKLSLLVLIIPPKPSITAPQRGFISWEHVCCSRYNSFWFMFYVECINVIIEYQDYEVLDIIREMLAKYFTLIENGKLTNAYNAGSIIVAFFDSFSVEPEQEQVLLEDHYIDYYFRRMIESKHEEAAKILIEKSKFLNWRILNLALPLIRYFPQELIEETASTMAFIIQMPNNFSHIIQTIFRPFIEFMSMLQTHFTGIGINNTRQIIWDDKKIALLHDNIDIAVNYCIIIAAVFNNILEQIPEEEWPVSTRQILVQFLYHWCQLPQTEEKVRSYALNALIPIMKAGNIFTDGFQFELPMLEIMVECQLAGYDVLSSALLYHFDLMFDIFVRQIFVRPRRESSLFFDAVLTSFGVCAEAQLMQAHVGSLLLLTQFWGREDPGPAKPILVSLADLFIDQATNADVQTIIESATNLDFVPAMFNFATEQVIEAGFEIMKSTKLVTTVKNIVKILVPWFAPIRVLPINKNIIQGIPSKFRRFNIISFLKAMSEVSKCVNEEQNEAFSQLWYELLRFKDNSVIVLLCIFEFDDTSIKERVFTQLLEREPSLVTKYLAKRCSFAFWYFLTTEQKQDINSIMWMLPVLTHAYTDYANYSDIVLLHYTTVLHFSLIFIEQTYKFFEDLISVFGPEFTDSVLQMAPDLEGGVINISQVTSKLAERLHESDPSALEKWADEAFRWGVCCNDVKIGTRSLIVFNALRGEFQPSYVPLLCDAVLYQTQGVSVDDCQQLSEYIGECFEIFYNNIDVPEVTSIAFEFASEFLDFKEIGNKFLRRAMPIFKYCAQNPIMCSAAKEILIKAFAPFAPSLETDVEAQNLLKDILQITNAPEALLVASPFIKHKLSFVDLNKTYEEIMSTPFDSLHATIVLQMFNDMIRTASQPLLDAIIDVSTEFVRKFKDCLPPKLLSPIYCTALTKITMFRSAIDFIMIISAVSPGVASYSMTNEEDAETKTFESIRQKIKTMVKENVDPIPITNCKCISQLRGIINQISPPKITPFSTQHEMFVGLRRADGSSRPTTMKRLNKQYSLSRGIALTNRSSVITSIATKTTEPQINIEKLPEPVVKGRLYANDENDSMKEQNKLRGQFLLTLDEFALLDE